MTVPSMPDGLAFNVAAAGAATLTVARLDEPGSLKQFAARATAKGARNAVVTDDGIVYVADGPDGKILVVRTAKGDEGNSPRSAGHKRVPTLRGHRPGNSCQLRTGFLISESRD